MLSDRIVVRITQEPGQSFLDRMIALVEGTARRKTPNEIALNILIAGLTIVFLAVTVTLRPLATYAGSDVSMTVLIALLVSLIPTTIGALLSAIGIAGMDRLVQRNVLALSGRAVEAAGDVDTLLLDKTGTITLGNRQATEFLPAGGVTERELAEAAQLSSLADETPEGRSIVVLAKERFDLRERAEVARGLDFVPFSAETRMSGVQTNGTSIRKGAADAVAGMGRARGGAAPGRACRTTSTRVARSGGTPLVVARDDRMLGVIHLKDVVKTGHDPALHRAAPDGHPHGDDHRRQPPDGGRDRRRGRRRRLPGPGDARGQDDPDPRGAGQGPPGRDDRRRHQRRARPSPRPTWAWP